MKEETRSRFHGQLIRLLRAEVPLNQVLENLMSVAHEAAPESEQHHTTAAFSTKWERYAESDEKENLYAMQRRWFLDLYGFSSEADLCRFLRQHPVILDAGCGLGYKAAWFAELAPESTVIGVDFSTSADQAARSYEAVPNLFFFRGDIADLPLKSGTVSFVCCDQVIMHTQDPDATFAELVRVKEPIGGELACYFYAKKALPRELLDEHFRTRCREMSTEELWEMSVQLTELGRRFSELQIEVDVPAIPALGIKEGRFDLQRFLYWNFLKCFWNEELGHETSVITNFDWYSPSNARRYSYEEVMGLVNAHDLDVIHLHQEEACLSGRFGRAD